MLKSSSIYKMYLMDLKTKILKSYIARLQSHNYLLEISRTYNIRQSNDDIFDENSPSSNMVVSLDPHRVLGEKLLKVTIYTYRSYLYHRFGATFRHFKPSIPLK